MLRELSPAAERNIAETRAELAEEAALLERVVLEALDRRRRRRRRASRSPAAALAGWEPALRRLALRALAERAAGRPVAARPRRAPPRSRGWPREPEGGTVELGGGLGRDLRVRARPLPRRARARRRAGAGRARPPGPRPGRRLGGARRASSRRPSSRPGPDLATLDAAALDGPVEVRTWREGDRIRPLGMSGTKTLRTCSPTAACPARCAATLPVVTVGGEVAWVAGVAVSEDFRLDAEHRARSRCSAPSAAAERHVASRRMSRLAAP